MREFQKSQRVHFSCIECLISSLKGQKENQIGDLESLSRIISLVTHTKTLLAVLALLATRSVLLYCFTGKRLSRENQADKYLITV